MTNSDRANADGLNLDSLDIDAAGGEGGGIDPRDERRRAWACEQLEVPLSPERRRLLGDFLDILDRDTLVPYEGDVDAFEALWSERWPAGRREPEAFELKDEEYLCGKVADFAKEMFTLPVGQRTARFAALQRAAVGCPRAEAHLADLRPGIEVDVASPLRDSSPELVFLADSLARLFVLRPVARARLYREVVPKALPEDPRFGVAVRKLQRGYPELAAFQPHWIEYLKRGVSTVTTAEKVRRQVAKAQPAESWVQDIRQKIPHLWLFIIWAIVFATVVTCIGISNNSNPSISPFNGSNSNLPRLKQNTSIEEINRILRSSPKYRREDQMPNDPPTISPTEYPQRKQIPAPGIGAPQPNVTPQLPDRFIEPKIIVPGDPPRNGNSSPTPPRPYFSPSGPNVPGADPGNRR